MKKPHKHAELIKAWADNPLLEFQWRITEKGAWDDVSGQPSWYEHNEYRIKPELKPDIVQEWYVSPNMSTIFRDTPNIRLTWDAEGKLKAAEVLND